MDTRQICELLAVDGIDASPIDIRVEARDDCWVAWLPSARMAWFPMNSLGLERLQTERRVLDLLASRCSFQVPRVLHVSGAGWQVRSMVPGLCEPWVLYRRLQNDRALARKIGRSLGAILAEQHTRVTARDAEAWLPTRPNWPEPWDLIESRLPQVVEDGELLREIGRVIQRCRADEAAPSNDRVLVHGDLGFHNLALESGTDDVTGIFDYEDAAWTDRHYDFRYFIFDHQDEDLLSGAAEVYEATLGIKLDRHRIRLFNAACAIGFLAYRHGTAPEALSCGRTLVQDLEWVRCAVRRVC